MSGDLKSLIPSVREGTNASARVHAALTAAALAGSLRDSQLVAAVREATAEIPLETIEIRDRAKALLAKAMTFYHCRENQNGYSELRAAAKALNEAGGSTDTTYVQIQTGLGAMAASKALYADATAPSERAYFGAARLGNLQLMSVSAANLALCFRRLGAGQEHLKWALTASKHADRCGDSYARVSAASELAYAFLTSMDIGRATQALESLLKARNEARLPSIRQEAVLHEADINWLLGDHRTAYERVEALLDHPEIETPIGLSGRIARWRTLYLIEAGRPQEAGDNLDSAYSNLTRLDSMDQAEVLCSLRQVAHVRSIPRDVQSQARAALARLPIECSRQLRDLGLLLPN
jgi:hypothetical protein